MRQCRQLLNAHVTQRDDLRGRHACEREKRARNAGATRAVNVDLHQRVATGGNKFYNAQAEGRGFAGTDGDQELIEVKAIFARNEVGDSVARVTHRLIEEHIAAQASGEGVCPHTAHDQVVTRRAHNRVTAYGAIQCLEQIQTDDDRVVI